MSTKQEREHEANKMFGKEYDQLSLNQKVRVMDKINTSSVGYLKKTTKKPKIMFWNGI